MQIENKHLGGTDTSILGAVIVSRLPLIIPTVGRGREQEVQVTIDVYRTAVKQVSAWEPEVLIITSPHLVMYADYFHISPGRALLPLIDAANIGLKEFTPEWYRKLGVDLETVKRSIVLAAEQCHVEVTTLLSPGENDSVEEIRVLAQWLASVNPEISLHLSQFFPRYRMTDKPSTQVDWACHLADEARVYLFFVYTGNC